MRVYGVDFTSRPTRRKPITCAVCWLEGGVLKFEQLMRFEAFEQFEASLQVAGPWIAAMDFPFGQSRTFIENIGWARNWQDYVRYVATMSRQEFKAALKAYRDPRPKGDKEHRRTADGVTGAVSPQKVYGVPVGLMFFAGAKRLLDSGVTIAGLADGDPGRLVFEAYPGVLARRVAGSYKSDERKKQTDAQQQARNTITAYISSPEIASTYGVRVAGAHGLEQDPTGDSLDALLCAIQAAWGWRQWPVLEAQLSPTQRLEGWIADPLVFERGE